MSINPGLVELEIRNTKIDFDSILKTQNFSDKLETLVINDKKGRKKDFDFKEIDSFAKKLANAKEFRFIEMPISVKSISTLCDSCPYILSLTLLHCPNLTNELFKVIGRKCNRLQSLTLGGGPTNYNTTFTLDGFAQLASGSGPRLNLTKISLNYCVHVGDQTIALMSELFRHSLTEFHVVRNCYETKVSKITDEAFKSLSHCPNLTKVSIVYSRKLGDKFPKYICDGLQKLKYLNLRDCTTQEDLSQLAISLPFLEEVNLSGDSWVDPVTLHSLAKHPNIKTLHIGHFNHADTQCDTNIADFPPNGLFIQSLFKNPKNFENVRYLFLEQFCSLTYWVDVKLLKLRPNLIIRYTPYEKVMPEENVPSLI